MKNSTYVIIAALATTLGQTQSQAATVLFTDNFNVPNATLDASSLAPGRRGGTLATTVSLRSARIQHDVQSNQLGLDPIIGSGRARVHDSSGWFDWSSGATGATIVTDRRFRVEMDLTAPNTTGDDWLSFNIGHDGSGSGEPGSRVNDSGTDYGILFRNNGGVQRFNNGTANLTTAGAYTATTSPQRIVLDFSIDSFANGANVDVVASIGGTVVDTSTFAWNNNGAGLFMEFGTNGTEKIVDNFSVSTVPEPTSAALLGLSGLALIIRRRRA